MLLLSYWGSFVSKLYVQFSLKINCCQSCSYQIAYAVNNEGVFMGPTQSPYILQLCMGPWYFWGVWPLLTPPYFAHWSRHTWQSTLKSINQSIKSLKSIDLLGRCMQQCICHRALLAPWFVVRLAFYHSFAIHSTNSTYCGHWRSLMDHAKTLVRNSSLLARTTATGCFKL